MNPLAIILISFTVSITGALRNRYITPYLWENGSLLPWRIAPGFSHLCWQLAVLFSMLSSEPALQFHLPLHLSEQ